MEGSKRTLVVLLCMHRSGSSLTANLLQRLGLSLGPFELLGAAPSNPHGHFESVPFYQLNQRVQQWAFGFPDEAPTSPDVLARLLETRAEWPSDRAIPEEWIDEGERLVRALIESGPVSGFKDPRTPLTRPFWNLVLSRIEDVEVVGVNLLRSPHEIAMSLCARSRGTLPYWTALDVVGVHLERMKAAADDGAVAHVVRFGGDDYWNDVRSLAEACGLNWNESIARRVYDPSCVHHQPAVIAHPAQDLLDDLSRAPRDEFNPVENAARLASDARRSEAVLHDRIVHIQAEWEKAVAARARFHELETHCMNLQRELDLSRQTVEEVEKVNRMTTTCLEQSESHLARVSESLVSNQERRVEAERLLAQFERNLAEAHDRQSRAAAELQRAHEAMRADHDRIAEVHAALAAKEELLDRAREREERRWLDCVALRAKLDKYESNAIIGAAVRGRRQFRRFWLKLRHLGPNGEPRSSRVDRPI